jgi:hypothetical protein
MKHLKFAALLLALAALTGCAHQVSLAPDLAKIERAADAAPRVKAGVAYYIPDAQRNQEIETAGGGGDKVSSKPYKDVESAFYKMLGNVFESVTRMSSPNDAQALASAKYVIIPELLVNSSSPSLLTWPPTRFGIEMSCAISDTSHKAIETVRVSGAGAAEFDEFKSDFGLSGKRAAIDAMLKMQAKLLELKLGAPATPATVATAVPAAAAH